MDNQKEQAFNQTEQQQKLFSALSKLLDKNIKESEIQNRKQNLKVTQIPEVPFSFLINDILTKQECKQILEGAQHQENIYMFNNDGVQRKTMRIQILHQNFAKWMFEVIKHKLVESYEVNPGEKEFGRLGAGKWELDSINQNFRFCKYDQSKSINNNNGIGGFFKPHFDGTYLKSEDTRTLFTILLYLSQDMEGGQTNFYAREPWNQNETQVLLASVKPVTGCALVFPQNVIHEGAALKSGSKQFVRTDVLYRRVIDQEGKNVSAEEQIMMMEKKEKAQCYLDLAREYQRCKQPMKAVEYYRKAFKINPALEQIM